MISECMNPACRKELRYLRDGRVVRVVKRNHDPIDPINVEHFWLCGSCSLALSFHFSGEGNVSLVPRSRRKAAKAASAPSAFTLVA